MTVYEELFPNGVGKISEELYATVKSICAVAQEVREYRVYRQERDAQIDENRAAFDEAETERLADEAETRQQQNAQMLEHLAKSTSAIGHAASFMPPGFTLPSLGVAATASLCQCGHPKHAHDHNGCIVCRCTEVNA